MVSAVLPTAVFSVPHFTVMRKIGICFLKMPIFFQAISNVSTFWCILKILMFFRVFFIGYCFQVSVELYVSLLVSCLGYIMANVALIIGGCSEYVQWYFYRWYFIDRHFGMESSFKNGIFSKTRIKNSLSGNGELIRKESMKNLYGSRNKYHNPFL